MRPVLRTIANITWLQVDATRLGSALAIVKQSIFWEASSLPHSSSPRQEVFRTIRKDDESSKCCRETYGCERNCKYPLWRDGSEGTKQFSSHPAASNPRQRPGPSQYNYFFEFDYEIRGQKVRMVVTSVTGHLMESPPFPLVPALSISHFIQWISLLSIKIGKSVIQLSCSTCQWKKSFQRSSTLALLNGVELILCFVLIVFYSFVCDFHFHDFSACLDPLLEKQKYREGPLTRRSQM